MTEKIHLFLPIKTVSEANSCECRWTKSSRHKLQRQSLCYFLKNRYEWPIPATITFKRIGDQLLDSDNLVIAFKWLRDELSDIMLGYRFSKPSKKAPNKPARRLYGRNDSDIRLTWKYDQEQGLAHGTWLTVESTPSETIIQQPLDIAYQLCYVPKETEQMHES